MGVPKIGTPFLPDGASGFDSRRLHKIKTRRLFCAACFYLRIEFASQYLLFYITVALCAQFFHTLWTHIGGYISTSDMRPKLFTEAPQLQPTIQTAPHSIMKTTLKEYLARLAQANPPATDAGISMADHIGNYLRHHTGATVYQGETPLEMKAEILYQSGDIISGVFRDNDQKAWLATLDNRSERFQLSDATFWGEIKVDQEELGNVLPSGTNGDWTESQKVHLSPICTSGLGMTRLRRLIQRNTHSEWLWATWTVFPNGQCAWVIDSD